MCVSGLPGHGSLLVVLGLHPLQEVLQFVAGFQLQAQVSLILGGTYNVTEEGRDVKAPWFHQVHQINDDAWKSRGTSSKLHWNTRLHFIVLFKSNTSVRAYSFSILLQVLIKKNQSVIYTPVSFRSPALVRACRSLALSPPCGSSLQVKIMSRLCERRSLMSL